MNPPDPLLIRAISGPDEASACAALMAASDPWKRMGRDQALNLKTVNASEAYVAVVGDEIIGLVLIAMNVPLIRGYVIGLLVKDGFRGRGVGTRLLRFAEERIFRDSPNVFLCVSTFNSGARRFYERLGYTRVGVIENYAIEGEGEFLMRKTIGPYATFAARKTEWRNQKSESMTKSE